jgi:catechol 2,3-dioxygenase-like lactoylglutathione lyase family enzyme
VLSKARRPFDCVGMLEAGKRNLGRHRMHHRCGVASGGRKSRLALQTPIYDARRGSPLAIRTGRIDHIHLHVADVERAADFYRDVFGASERFRVGEQLDFMSLPGGAIVALDGRPEGHRNPPHVGISLADGEDLNAAVGEVERAGGRLVEQGEHAPGIPYAYVADPDGNVIEL